MVETGPSLEWTSVITPPRQAGGDSDVGRHAPADSTLVRESPSRRRPRRWSGGIAVRITPPEWPSHSLRFARDRIPRR